MEEKNVIQTLSALMHDFLLSAVEHTEWISSSYADTLANLTSQLLQSLREIFTNKYKTFTLSYQACLALLLSHIIFRYAINQLYHL